MTTLRCADKSVQDLLERLEPGFAACDEPDVMGRFEVIDAECEVIALCPAWDKAALVAYVLNEVFCRTEPPP